MLALEALTSPRAYSHKTIACVNSVLSPVSHLHSHAARSGIDNMGSTSRDRGTVLRDDVSSEMWSHYISLLTAQRRRYVAPDIVALGFFVGEDYQRVTLLCSMEGNA